MLVEATLEIEVSAAEAWSDILAAHGDERWSVFEDVDARSARVSGYFESEASARVAWDALCSVLPRGFTPSGVPGMRSLVDEDWRESYKAHFKAWRHGRLHWIPEWERAKRQLPRGHVAVFLDPGMAFGTGNHETTRLCVRRLVEVAEKLSPARRRALSVIDAGCGSGILGISAAKLGFSDVFAFDNDSEAVAIARKNARRNGVGSALRWRVADVARALQRRRGDLVLANIQSNVLVNSASALLGSVQRGGMLVLSGILAKEADEVARVFRAQAGGGRLWVQRLNEWASVTWSAPFGVSRLGRK